MRMRVRMVRVRDEDDKDEDENEDEDGIFSLISSKPSTFKLFSSKICMG